MSVKAEPELKQPADRVIHISAAERSARGKAARAATPRSSQAQLDLDERDPVASLDEQSASRVPELVPIRYGRMLVSPFTFYRGAARLMAHDLASTPNAGLTVQLCGDAHLSNFGGFASPDRALVFDLNDFDETLAGPFEWDVKRLAASFEIAGRDRGFDDAERREFVLAVVRAYRKAMRDSRDAEPRRLVLAARRRGARGACSRPRIRSLRRRRSAARSRRPRPRTACGRSPS